MTAACASNVRTLAPADQGVPGMYAIEVVGDLPDYALDYCEQWGVPARADVTKSK